jgi:hypothetical protein
MQGRAAQFACLVWVALVGMSIFAPPAYSQTQQGESDALLTIITTLKKACMPSQSLRLVTGNDKDGNTEL